MDRSDFGATYKCVIFTLTFCLLAGAHVRSATAESVATPIADQDTFPSYDLTIELDEATRSISGDLSLDWVNTTGSAQDFLYFRLYPNAEYYGGAELTVYEVMINDEPVLSVADDDQTVLQVIPESPIENAASLTVSMTFSTIVPTDSVSGFGIFQFASAAGIWNLANWYPILAGYEADSGWYLQAPTQFGDPTFSETSEYLVSLTMPDDLTVISTGAEVSKSRDAAAGTATVEIESGPAREFAMTLMSDLAEVAEESGGDISVRVTLPRDQEIPVLAEFMAGVAADAIGVYESWLGDYPSAEFDLTVAPLSGANGVSWSGLTWFNLGQITADGTLTEEEKVGLTFVILHEVGHQWIANIIGSNNNDHGFMTEGLVNALTVLVALELYGDEQAEMYLRSWVAGPYTSLLNDDRDGIADAPITDETNGVLRGLLIYGKAAVGFIALREEIGPDAFLFALAQYGEIYRFGVSGPDDLHAAFESASGTSLDELWSFWFNQDDTDLADVNEVLDAFAP